MRLPNFLKRFSRQKPDDKSKPQITRLNGHVPRLLQMVEKTQEEEYTCDDVYELLDQFAEMVARGEDASQIMPLVDQHIKMCPDCREEYEALLRILEKGS